MKIFPLIAFLILAGALGAAAGDTGPMGSSGTNSAATPDAKEAASIASGAADRMISVSPKAEVDLAKNAARKTAFRPLWEQVVGFRNKIKIAESMGRSTPEAAAALRAELAQILKRYKIETQEDGAKLGPQNRRKLKAELKDFEGKLANL